MPEGKRQYGPPGTDTASVSSSANRRFWKISEAQTLEKSVTGKQQQPRRESWRSKLGIPGEPYAIPDENSENRTTSSDIGFDSVTDRKILREPSCAVRAEELLS